MSIKNLTDDQPMAVNVDPLNSSSHARIFRSAASKIFRDFEGPGETELPYSVKETAYDIVMNMLDEIIKLVEVKRGM